MCYVKIMEEKPDYKPFNGHNGLENLIQYIYRPSKTETDSRRPIFDLFPEEYTGCNYFNDEMEHYPEAVIKAIYDNQISKSSNDFDIVRHRIVSFRSSEFFEPKDIIKLARKIIDSYWKIGHIACFGIHRDSCNVHMHIAVASISVYGKPLLIPNEGKDLYKLCSQWENKHIEAVYSNEERYEKYKNDIYGDDIPFNYKITANSQMSYNKYIKENARRKYNKKW